MFSQPAVKIRSNFLSISVHAYVCWKLKVEALRTSVLMYVGYWLLESMLVLRYRPNFMPSIFRLLYDRCKNCRLYMVRAVSSHW